MTAVVVPAGVWIDAAVARELAALRPDIIEAAMRCAGRDGRPFPHVLLEALDACVSAASSANGSVPVPKLRGLPPVDDPDAWMTTARAAEVLGITERAVRQSAAKGRLPSRRRGGDTGRWLILRDAVEARAAGRSSE